MVAVVVAPVREVARVGVRPAEIKTAVSESLEVGFTVVVDECGIETGEGGVVVLSDLCSG